jgi:hypothetical protein
MNPLSDVAAALARWLDGPVLLLVALAAGYFGARLVGEGGGRSEGGARPSPSRRDANLSRSGHAGRSADDEAIAEAAAADDANPDDAGTLGSPDSRLFEMQALLERLEQENRYLEQAVAHRGADIQLLTARMSEAAARDREELVHLQEELEAEHRIGTEKARLIRSLEASLRQAEVRRQEVEALHERQRFSLSALQAALAHAKRAQASTGSRLAHLREQLRLQAAPAAAVAGSGGERVVERIVEIPVETIVYRDREVPVEVPIEVPVGFTALPAPPAPACGNDTRRTGRVPPDAGHR